MRGVIFFIKTRVHVHKKGIISSARAEPALAKRVSWQGGGARKNAIFGPTAPFSITPPARSGPWTLRWMWTLGEFARPRERVCVVVGL